MTAGVYAYYPLGEPIEWFADSYSSTQQVPEDQQHDASYAQFGCDSPYDACSGSYSGAYRLMRTLIASSIAQTYVKVVEKCTRQLTDHDLRKKYYERGAKEAIKSHNLILGRRR